ncbi:superoxide dismutase [Fe] [Plasmodium yoelii yoelii]|uniref:superoxide dismutase n=2 Tax=Plasmodium yoelii TaxID=5861 RepID=A0AAF0B5T1_PLAYO|nr:superoxide dismutase [Fe] [Plasmodium yoelii yoelii]
MNIQYFLCTNLHFGICLFLLTAQIFNHNFFWLGLKSNGEGKPYGEIKKKIEESFISFENFKEQFTKEASSHFGSGWIWLVIKEHKLKIYQGHDAECPIKHQIGHPILALDVWEHAYYVDYKNSRNDYIKGINKKLKKVEIYFNF